MPSAPKCLFRTHPLPFMPRFWTCRPLRARDASLFGCTDPFWPQRVPFCMHRLHPALFALILDSLTPSGRNTSLFWTHPPQLSPNRLFLEAPTPLGLEFVPFLDASTPSCLFCPFLDMLTPL